MNLLSVIEPRPGALLANRTGLEDARRVADVADLYLCPGPGFRVVDFGCGDGRVAVHLQKYFDDLWMVDESMDMLNLAAEKVPQAKIACSNGTDGQLDGLGAHLICVIDVLDRYFAVAGGNLLAGLANVLDPRGLLAVNGSDGASIRRMATRAGFRVLRAPSGDPRGLYVLELR